MIGLSMCWPLIVVVRLFVAERVRERRERLSQVVLARAQAEPVRLGDDRRGALLIGGGILLLVSQTGIGGDIGKARAALTQIEAEATKATGETRTMMRSEADRLRMGIEAYGKEGGKKEPPAAADAGLYNIYRQVEVPNDTASTGQLFGYIGSSETTSFVDRNGLPN